MAKQTPIRKKQPVAAPRRYRILSLDGGGIRGVITAVWLSALQQRLPQPLHKHFDLIAGTSTGAILAAAVGLEIDPARIVDLYRARGREIFPAPMTRLWDRLGRTFQQGLSAPKYHDAGLERVLRDLLPGPFADLRVKPTLVTSYNTLTREATVFKNTKPEHAGLDTWQVVKASASAPTYFPAHVMPLGQADAALIDGGVVANNPAACAVAEAVKVNEAAGTGLTLDDFVLASLGTGHSTRPIPIAAAREWGAAEWVIPVLDVLMDGPADATDYIVRQLLPRDRYLRLQTPLQDAYDDMDNADRTNINALISVAQHYLQTGGGEDRLDQIAALIR